MLAREQGHQAPAHDIGLAQHDLAHVLFELGHQSVQLRGGKGFQLFGGSDVQVHDQDFSPKRQLTGSVSCWIFAAMSAW
jgi:hypothetical protein